MNVWVLFADLVEKFARCVTQKSSGNRLSDDVRRILWPSKNAFEFGLALALGLILLGLALVVNVGLQLLQGRGGGSRDA